MKFISTRGYADADSSCAAITQGLAADGGLFIPSTIPSIDVAALLEKELTYQDMAMEILSPYLSDYGLDTLKHCIASAYGTGFDDPSIAPVVQLDNATYVMELWHGPTAAFKDMALQLLPHLLVEGKAQLGSDEKTIILVATSGDTGKAALEGFRDVDNTHVVTYYPKDGVAPLQEIQMTTQQGQNVHVIAVEGNFDDTQTGVKQIFSDPDVVDTLRHQGMAFSSANSMNFGRLCPQIVYYFHAYYQLSRQGDIQCGEFVDFVVPTGNFGNILAGWYAKQMGLPVGRLVCASNTNNILTDFFQSGAYNTQRPFHKTMSPSMDILISSNLERLLYELSGRNAQQVREWMGALKDHGHYVVDQQLNASLAAEFDAAWTDEKQTQNIIRQVWARHQYLMDTHTAVAYGAIAQIPSSGNKRIVLSTANPYKFPEDVLHALTESESQGGSFDVVEQLQQYTQTQAPQSIADLQGMPRLHHQSCPKDEMRAVMMKAVLQ